MSMSRYSTLSEGPLLNAPILLNIKKETSKEHGYYRRTSGDSNDGALNVLHMSLHKKNEGVFIDLSIKEFSSNILGKFLHRFVFYSPTWTIKKFYITKTFAKSLLKLKVT